MLRVQEHDPEVIVNHIQGDLALADRALDKGLDHVERVIQEKLITRAGRDLLEGDKGVGAQFLLIAHQVRRLQPFRLDEQLLKRCSWASSRAKTMWVLTTMVE